jgi:hypothetical protein
MQKVCPIMSRPKQGNYIGLDGKPLYKNENECLEYGWVLVDGKPFSGLMPCLKERCEAWQEGCVLL